MPMNRLPGAGVTTTESQSSGTVFHPEGFVVCPPALGPCLAASQGWIQEVYRLAYERSLEALRPSWYERVLLATAN